MSDISTSRLIGDTGNQSGSALIQWMFSPVVLSVFLAFMIGTTFFISEHSLVMSKNLSENFVAEIEDQESWADGGNKFRQISFLSCAAVGALSLIFGRAGNFRVNLPVLLVIAYILWAGASATWSLDRGTTVRRYILVLCCCIGCLGFSRFLSVKDAVFAAMLVSVGYLVIGIGAEIVCGTFAPHTGQYRFSGTVHPNIQAATLATGCIAAYSMARIKPNARTIYYGIFGFLFLFLVLTKCRSATGAVPVALGIIWFVAQPTRNIAIITVAGFWLLSSIVLLCIVTDFNPITANSDVLLLGRAEETGSSLTGRLPLWEDLLEYLSRSPVKGFGFGAFWTPRHIYEIAVSQEWVISEAHSSYLDTALQLGVIGAALFAAIIVSTFLYAAILSRVTKDPAYLFLVGGVFFCLMRGFTESGLTGASPVTAFFFMALAAHSWNGSSVSPDAKHNHNHQLNQTA